ncbi:hypothetical protein LCGC14_1957180, partial [marine sediment metagenome]
MTYDEQGPGGPPPPGKQAVDAGEAYELTPKPVSPGEQSPASEASGDDKVKASLPAEAVFPVLDDPRSIEEGREEDEPETTRRVALGRGMTIGQIERMQADGKTIEIDPDGQAYEIVELPRDHAAGRSQRGVLRLAEVRHAEPPVDHEGDIPQAGSPADPDPLTIHGFRMAKIAAV